MPEPREFPCWRFYPDDRSVVVQNQTEYDALAAGHADNPSGPFPDEEADGPQELREMVDPVESAALHAQARTMRAAGMSQQAIADHFGISRRTVRQWLED